MSTSITISRAERDLIHNHLGYWLPGKNCSDHIPFDTREEADESIRKMQVAASIFDELGWAEDDSRQTFTVTMSADLIERLREIKEDAEDALPGQHEHREKARNGDRDYWHVGFKTVDATVAQYDRTIAMYGDELRIAEALLMRLEAEAVTA